MDPTIIKLQVSALYSSSRVADGAAGMRFHFSCVESKKSFLTKPKQLWQVFC